MPIIAMTREMGTLGKEVARAFARRMNYTVIHYELTEGKDERLRQGEESEVYRFLEGTREDLDHWRSNRAGGGFLSREDVFEIALEGNVLIRGWGAARLLRGIPNVLSLRVCAPMAFRVEQMIKRLAIGDKEARREIERNDAAHSGVFMRFFGADWVDPLNYGLVLNTGQLSVETCTDILCDAVASPAFSETAASRRCLRDRLLEARIRSAIKTDQNLASSSRHIHVDVDGASVRLYGLVTKSGAARAVERLVAGQSGIERLQNDVAQAGRFD